MTQQDDAMATRHAQAAAQQLADASNVDQSLHTD